MGAETDQFIVATFALWAGDFDYVESLLGQYSPPAKTSKISDVIESPEELIRRTGALRLRQIWQKKGEFKKLASAYSSDRGGFNSSPVIIETNNLRGALWRIGSREFQLHGYLKMLERHEEMIRLAHREASRNELLEPQVTEGEANLFPGEDDKPRRPLGVSWNVTGDPFLQARVSDLCLVEVNGIWTGSRLPKNAEDIMNPFSSLLESIDPDPILQKKVIDAHAKR
jgi:hypothetical protein